jgi:hypothetical protein
MSKTALSPARTVCFAIYTFYVDLWLPAQFDFNTYLSGNLSEDERFEREHLKRIAESSATITLPFIPAPGQILHLCLPSEDDDGMSFLTLFASAGVNGGETLSIAPYRLLD